MDAKAKRKSTRKSIPFHRYTDAEWAAIEQKLPQKKSPPGRDIRFELEQMGREFWAMRHQRLLRPSARDREGLHQCIELMERFESRSLKKALEPAYRKMKAWDDLLVAWNSEAFQRQRDAHRELRYGRIIGLWEGPLGGRLGVSTTGPLASFLDAALGPILGAEKPGFEGIKAILQREKNRRKDHPRFWKGFPDRRWEKQEIEQERQREVEEYMARRQPPSSTEARPQEAERTHAARKAENESPAVDDDDD